MYVNLLFMATVLLALTAFGALAAAGVYFRKRNRKKSTLLLLLSLAVLIVGLLLAQFLLAYFGALVLETGG